MRLAIAIAIFAAAAPAFADATEARFFDELGRAAFARGRYDEALSHFLAAQEAAPSVRTLYNLAVCADAARRPAAAFAWFEEYLAGGDDDATRRADAEQRMARMRRSLALVRVTTSPAHATLYVDRRELGAWGRSPRTLVLAPGEHVIEVELEGYEPASVTVTAVVGEERSASAELRRRTGTLHVEANVGARVIAAGVEGAAGSDLSVPIGEHRVRVEAPGHEPEELSVRVREGATERRRVRLVPLPAPQGRLLVATGGVRARVTVDGTPRAETPAALSVSAGEHRVDIAAEGYLPWTGRVEVGAGESEYLDVTLVPAR